MTQIETIEDLREYLLGAIEVCQCSIERLYQHGVGKEHPEFENLSCAKWVYEKLLSKLKPSNSRELEEENKNE